jgi:hypothetical protein
VAVPPAGCRVVTLCSRLRLRLGADSPFFCSAVGSAPQELNNIRHEAKNWSVENRTKSKQIFYSALAVETPYPRVTTVPTIRTIFSLKRLCVVASRYVVYLRYGMQQFLYWRVQQVLLLCGGHQKVIDAVGGGTKLILKNRRWGLVLNHYRAMLFASRYTVGI